MPNGKVIATQLIPLPPANSITVRAQVVCVDEDGVEYVFNATSFNGELKPYSAKQELPYRDWFAAVIAADKWREVNWSESRLESDYRAGLTPKQTYEKHYEQRNA